LKKWICTIVATEEMKTIRPRDNNLSTGDKLCIAEQQGLDKYLDSESNLPNLDLCCSILDLSAISLLGRDEGTCKILLHIQWN